jgi:hypothetical protein
MKESRLENYIGQPHHTDKKGEEIDILRFLPAARFQRTIGRVWQKETRLATLLQQDPSKLDPKELIRAYEFGQRLFARTMRDHENARNPEFSVGTFALKGRKSELDEAERNEAVTEAEKFANIILPRLELFRREMHKRGVESVSKDGK